MKIRSRFWLAAAAGLFLSQPGFAAPPIEPAPLGLGAVPMSLAQRTANTIAANLRQSGQLQGFNIDISFNNGIAELTGTVRDQSQKEEALRIVQGVPGVERVVDRITTEAAIRRVSDVPPPTPLPEASQLPTPIPAPPTAGLPPEPQPIFAAPPPSPYALNPPQMPPYAWPTYAPYNNFSRVACPEAYPYNAFPFIGPQYPFPKIPLGWRSVRLEWDDGYWWFGRTSTKYDWWKLRYH